MKKIIWPNDKKFAFSIVDDTDNGTKENLSPVYKLLSELNIKTTKTVWSYPPKDSFKGECLLDPHYLNFIHHLMENGFEIASHGVGSGKFTREEIIKGLNIFEKKLGSIPVLHANHASNYDNLYWGSERFQYPLKTLYNILSKGKRSFHGTNKNSSSFWGDLSKRHFKYIRNHTFNDINTLKYDPEMPYRDKSKDQYSNFWFSSSDGHTIKEFNALINPSNINRLRKEGGACIIYTHFASGFVKNGSLDPTFEKSMRYLANQPGWFVPTSEILEFLLTQKKNEYASRLYLNKLDLRWLIDRIIKKIKYGH